MSGYIDFSKVLEEYNRQQEHPELLKPEQRCQEYVSPDGYGDTCELQANHPGRHRFTWE